MLKGKKLLFVIIITLYFTVYFPWTQIVCSDTANYNFDEYTSSASDRNQEDIDEIDDGLISLNFNNVTISEALKVLSDITGKIVVTSENLEGSINIDSLHRVTPEVVVSILKSAITAKGYNVIENDLVLKVVAVKNSKQANVEVSIGNSPDNISDVDVIITQVIPVEYASSVKLKTLLQPLIGPHGNIIANERSNILIITDSSSNIKRIAKIIVQMDQHLTSNHQVKTFVVNYGNAETIAKIISDLSNGDNQTLFPPEELATTNGKYLELFGNIEAFADNETNSIVVSTSPINYPSIEKLVKRLDVFPPQAMIEVVILDVTLDDDFTVGVEFSDATTPTLTTAGYKTDITSNDFNESTLHSFLGLGTAASTSGFTWRVLNSKETAQALGFILKSQENSKVVSTPKILASNNKESSITIAQEIPILESSVTDLANNVTNSNIRYQDIGLILKVTPRISRDGFVNLDVHVELSDLSAQTLLNSSVINKREASATVILPDKHTVVMGGLIRDNNSVVENKVPLFGDIPLIGNLFKKTAISELRTELIIFITPHIMTQTEDLIKISAESNKKRIIMKSARTKRELKKAVEDITKNDENLINKLKELNKN